MVFRMVFLVILLATSFKRSDSMIPQPHFTSGGPHVSSFTVGIIKDLDWHKRCAGSLITQAFVMTAAQCGDFDVAELILGALDILSREKTQIRETIHARDFIAHPFFDWRTMDNDIALIRLTVFVKLGPFVNVVQLPVAKFKVDSGTVAYLTGWERRTNGYSNILSQTEVRIHSMDKCDSEWPSSRITEKKLCATSTRHMVGLGCIEDPGSPLTLHDQPDILIGFMSVTANCRSFHSDVYTNVASFRDWIDGVIESYNPQSQSVANTTIS